MNEPSTEIMLMDGICDTPARVGVRMRTSKTTRKLCSSLCATNLHVMGNQPFLRGGYRPRRINNNRNNSYIYDNNNSNTVYIYDNNNSNLSNDYNYVNDVNNNTDCNK